ncbi:MAG: MarR family winged helix-turn-helix transcriptional regulator [Thermoplasmatota archaeon]
MSDDETEQRCGPHSVGRLLAHIHKRTRRYMSTRLAHYGIGGPTYGFLFHLYKKDGISESEITRHMLVDKATTTRALSKLEKLGYVERHQDPQDRRVYKVFLTSKARSIEPDLDKIREEWVHLVLGDFDASERRLFLDNLNRIEGRLRTFSGSMGCEE